LIEKRVPLDKQGWTQQALEARDLFWLYEYRIFGKNFFVDPRQMQIGVKGRETEESYTMNRAGKARLHLFANVTVLMEKPAN
jgi:hypothetical protein